MKAKVFLSGILVLFGILIAVLSFRVVNLEGRLRGSGGANGAGITTLQESLKRVEADLVTVEELAPGLGEYMTTIQLHAGKLWFAVRAANWELALYEP